MKEQILKKFEDKYSSFELCNQVSKPELDKLKDFISNAIDKTREETIREVKESLPEDRTKWTVRGNKFEYHFNEFNECPDEVKKLLKKLKK